MTPIYIKRDCITSQAAEALSARTGRLVVFVSEDPYDCVYDEQEEIRDRLAGYAMIGMLAGRKKDLDHYLRDPKYLESCYLFADNLISIRNKKRSADQ